MQFIKIFNTSVLGRWQMLAAISVFSLVACTADSSAPSPGDQDDASDTSDESMTIQRSEISTPGEVSVQAGCAHIRYCDQPNSSNEVVCDTDDSPCSPGARLNECVSDADAVCGSDWGVITLDPVVVWPGVGTFQYIVQ